MLNNSPLLTSRTAYKPFSYPWAYEAWKLQQQVHWLAAEIPMADDVRDWQRRLTDGEKNLLTQIFRFFTQADIDVAGAYIDHYMPLFKAPEVRMMMSAFAAMEGVHIDAYSHLISTIGMPDSTYSAFLQYKEMKDKHDYFQRFNMNTPKDIALTIAAFSAFSEGLQLFASFAILMNFPRFNKMKGMGQIVSWSVRDESLHVQYMMRLFHEFIREQSIDPRELEKPILGICRDIVEGEDAFITLAFEAGDVQGLSPQEVQQYIRYIADRRLQQLGYSPYFGIAKNPLPWMDEMMNAPEHANFFEQKPTEYSKGASKGSWDDVFSSYSQEAANG